MLRLFDIRYLEECADIFYDVYKNPPFEYNWIDKKGSYEYIKDLIKTPKFMGFVYFSEGKLTAVCFGTKNDYFSIKRYKITEFFVKQEYSSKGYGSHFLSEIENYLCSRGISAIELDTKKSVKAYGFYKKNGFNDSSSIIHMIKIISE